MRRRKNKLVSVVIPTFERPKFFSEALESVLAQSHTNLEIFVTDNSRNTETKEVIKKYMKEDSRIIYEYHPEFIGARSNWKRARSYNNPKAEYINWLMDDDLFKPTKIEEMLRVYLSCPNVALVSSVREKIDEDSKKIEDIRIVNFDHKDDVILNGSFVGKHVMLHASNWIGEPTTALIKKANLYNNDLGWVPTVNTTYQIADYTTWLACLEHGDLYYMQDVKSSFREHGSNQQNEIRIKVASAICWALCMEYSWKNKKYLLTKEDCMDAIEMWDKVFLWAMGNVEKEKYNDQQVLSDLLNMYNRMHSLL